MLIIITTLFKNTNAINDQNVGHSTPYAVRAHYYLRSISTMSQNPFAQRLPPLIVTFCGL